MRRQLQLWKSSNPYSDYKNLVLADSPYIYHDLKEVSGTSFADLSGNSRTGTAVGNITLNQVPLIPNGQAFSDKSALFQVNGNVTYQNQISGVSEFTLECLFRTSSNFISLIGYTDTQSADGQASDKSLYVNSSGQMELYTSTNGGVLITSSASYNDNKTHIVTATVGIRGTELWVDGTMSGFNSAPYSLSYPGYWHIGYSKSFVGNLNFFNGIIDELSIYHYQISKNLILARHSAALSGI